MKHLISISDLTKEEIIKLVDQAAQIKQSPTDHQNHLQNKIIATLFFEPSTRTRLSFESAILRLGGKVIGFADPGSSSVKKGETLEDTIKVVNKFADAIIMRHPESGAAQRAVSVSSVPIINGGDGIREHPTQALLDIFTIDEHRHLSEHQLNIALVGDLKYGRTVHSLSLGLAHFNPKFYFVSPPALLVPDALKQKLTDQNVDFQEFETWDDVAESIDILYMTRVQKERFDDPAEYERLKGSYILNKETAAKFKDNCLFMHPLPRIGEIDPALDDDPRAIYFKQVENGVWMRMAILMEVLK